MTSAASPAPDHPVLGADALLDALFQQARVGITVVDRDLRFVRVNGVFGIFGGKPQAEIIGRTIAEVLPEIAGQIIPPTQKVLATGKPVVDQEVRAAGLFADGEHAFRTIRYPVLAADGTVVGVTSMIVDVTDLRKAQIELDDALVLQRERDAAELAAKRGQVEMLARYRMIFEGASVGILRVDPRRTRHRGEPRDGADARLHGRGARRR